MSPRFVLGRENVPCVAEVVNRSLKADCTEFTFHLQESVSYQKIYNRYSLSVNIYIMRELFCQLVCSIFEFYAINYASVFAFEYQSNFETMPTSLGVTDAEPVNIAIFSKTEN